MRSIRIRWKGSAREDSNRREPFPHAIPQFFGTNFHPLLGGRLLRLDRSGIDSARFGVVLLDGYGRILTRGSLAFGSTSVDIVVTQNLDDGTMRMFDLSPLPADDRIDINFAAIPGGDITVTLTATHGAEAGQWQFDMAGMKPHLSIPIGSLPSGVYLVTVRAGTRSESQRILVER